MIGNQEYLLKQFISVFRLVAKGQVEAAENWWGVYISPNTMANRVKVCLLESNRVIPCFLVFQGTEAPNSGRAAEELATQVRYIILTKAFQEGTDAVAKKSAFQQGKVLKGNDLVFPGRR